MTDLPATKPGPAHAPVRPRSRHARLGWSGFFFVFITVFLAVGAVNSQNNLLFWVFGLSVAAVLVSGLISGNSMLGIDLVCDPVPDAPVGEPQEVAYTAVNRNRLLPAFALTIREDAAGDVAACAAHVAPSSSARVTGRWTPGRRGVFTFDKVTVESRFPFGFIVKSLRFSCPRRAIATPATLTLRPGLLAALGDGESEHRVKRARRGAVGAYFGLRNYVPGDPGRLIAWRPSARRSDLLVVEHAEPQGQSLWIHVPRPVGPVDPVLAERTLAIVAALVRSGSEAGRPVGVWIPWAGVRLAPATGAHAARRASRALGLLDLDAPPQRDAPAPMRPGDACLTAPMQQGGPGSERLDPSRPEDWLAPGESLPEALRFPSVARAASDGGAS